MTRNEEMTVSTGTGELCGIVAENLKKLIARNGLTQKELAEKTGVTAASMTDYCRGRRLPTAEFFVALKRNYGISIDEFLTRGISVSRSRPSDEEEETSRKGTTTYRKYCGVYNVYYFDTARLKGRDTLSSRDSLLYGVLCVYETPSSLGLPHYGCEAVLGFHDRDRAAALKEKLEGMRQPSEIVEHIGREYAATAYHGDFEMSREHAFISMTHAETDKVLMIFYRVDSNKKNYTGGIGTINSVTKGRERMPVIQFIGISRHPLLLSAEEIHHRLLLDVPAFRLEDETEEIINTFKKLYLDDEGPGYRFSEHQKAVVVQSTLERMIRKCLERNLFRYAKISEEDDDDWYHGIKDAAADGDAP